MYFDVIKSISYPNKYTTWYISICENAQNRAQTRVDAMILFDNVEKHHILPKSFHMGGEKDPNNMVYLSIREHFLVHWLLIKMVSGIQKAKMSYALQRLLYSKNNRNNKHKILMRNIIDRNTSGRLHHNTGKKLSGEVRAKISKSVLATHPGRGKKQSQLTSQRKVITRRKNSNIWHSQETIVKMSQVKQGSNNPSFGKCWISHEEYGMKFIPKDQLDLFLKLGWYKGKAARSIRAWNSSRNLPKPV